MLFVFTTNLANNKEKTAERSSLFLFFEKKLQKDKSHPVLFSKKYLKNIRVSDETPFFVRLDFLISGIFSLKHLSPDGG